jgi:phosphoribosylanthranilate isomerase
MNALCLKICGLTNASDALTAVDAGADLLGLIFVPGTPRALSVEQAQTLISTVQSGHHSAKQPRFVGVFQDASLHDIQTHCAILPLDFIQLHGAETPDFCRQMPLPVIKTILWQPETPPQSLQNKVQSYLGAGIVKAILIDLPKGQPKRSLLETTEQAELKNLLAQFPILLAGGLTPENLSEVLTTFQPQGIDVASGIEQAPGHKDPIKLRTFCQLAKQFETPTIGDSLLCNL